MRDLMPGNLPWRSLLVIGVVALVAVPSWSLSQPPGPETEKQEKVELKDHTIRLQAQPVVHGDVVVQLADNDKQPAGKEGDRLDRLEKQLDALLKEVKSLRGEKPTTAKPGEKGRIVIHADTKELTKPGIPGEKVQVIRSTEKAPVTVYTAAPHLIKDSLASVYQVTAAEGDSTVLTRSTYKMPKDKAESLANFLKDQVKGHVLETKVEGDGIVVTTTPDAQRTIGQFIALVQGKPIQAHLNIHYSAPKMKAPEDVKFFVEEKPQAK